MSIDASMAELGKIMVLVGIVLVLAGLFFTFVGRLPGDIVIKKEQFGFYFPVTSSILISVLLSLLLYILSRFFR